MRSTAATDRAMAYVRPMAMILAHVGISPGRRPRAITTPRHRASDERGTPAPGDGHRGYTVVRAVGARRSHRDHVGPFAPRVRAPHQHVATSSAGTVTCFRPERVHPTRGAQTGAGELSETDALRMPVAVAAPRRPRR